MWCPYRASVERLDRHEGRNRRSPAFRKSRASVLLGIRLRGPRRGHGYNDGVVIALFPLLVSCGKNRRWNHGRGRESVWLDCDAGSAGGGSGDHRSGRGREGAGCTQDSGGPAAGHFQQHGRVDRSGADTTVEDRQRVHDDPARRQDAQAGGGPVRVRQRRPAGSGEFHPPGRAADRGSGQGLRGPVRA